MVEALDSPAKPTVLVVDDGADNHLTALASVRRP